VAAGIKLARHLNGKGEVMATSDELDRAQKAHETALNALLADRAGKSRDEDWALVRALCHRAVHLCAERKAGEFCALATLMADMINHAHGLMHPGTPDAATHEGGFH
jgi:hypothetical protein